MLLERFTDLEDKHTRFVNVSRADLRDVQTKLDEALSAEKVSLSC